MAPALSDSWLGLTSPVIRGVGRRSGELHTGLLRLVAALEQSFFFFFAQQAGIFLAAPRFASSASP